MLVLHNFHLVWKLLFFRLQAYQIADFFVLNLNLLNEFHFLWFRILKLLFELPILLFDRLVLMPYLFNLSHEVPHLMLLLFLQWVYFLYWFFFHFSLPFFAEHFLLIKFLLKLVFLFLNFFDFQFQFLLPLGRILSYTLKLRLIVLVYFMLRAFLQF
jgi:hypothetical protein